MTREEAIDVYNGLINTKIKEAFEFFAPELREINKEEIRKDIIGGLMWQRDNLKSEGPHDNNLILPGFCLAVGKHLSYLEKQKEHSMSAEEVLTRAGLKPYKDGNQWCILAGDNIQEGICGFGDTIEDALYEFLKEVLDLQKEQKPAEKQDYSGLTDLERAIHRGFLSAGGKNVPVTIINETAKECLAQMKPAEWSEEDELMRNRCIADLGYLTEYEPQYKERYDAQISWLKSLRPQPKAKLTLLDENIIKAAVAFVEQNDHFNCWGGIDKHTVIKALRSIKPSWKPSEEQMEALRDTIDLDKTVFRRGKLIDLLDDLKKL